MYGPLLSAKKCFMVAGGGAKAAQVVHAATRLVCPLAGSPGQNVPFNRDLSIDTTFSQTNLAGQSL